MDLRRPPRGLARDESVPAIEVRRDEATAARALTLARDRFVVAEREYRQAKRSLEDALKASGWPAVRRVP
jgi:hypothetical protein